MVGAMDAVIDRVKQLHMKLYRAFCRAPLSFALPDNTTQVSDMS